MSFTGGIVKIFLGLLVIMLVVILNAVWYFPLMIWICGADACEEHKNLIMLVPFGLTFIELVSFEVYREWRRAKNIQKQ